MVLKECPYCHIEVDKRGYTQHIRKCREIQEIKEAENMIEEEPVKEDAVKKDPVEEDPEPKNLKTPKLTRMIAVVLGSMVVVITLILMLISPKSKGSETKQEQTPKRRFQRNQ